MRLILSLVIISLIIISCSSKDIKDNIPVAKVGTKVLYLSDLEKNIPAGTSSEDSIIISEYFVRNWINDILLYDVASKNIKEKENIESLVEDYRKSLIIYQYQEQLVSERLAKDINENTLMAYYDKNKEKFQLDRPLYLIHI